jgi:hypothetical protein
MDGQVKEPQVTTKGSADEEEGDFDDEEEEAKELKTKASTAGEKRRLEGRQSQQPRGKKPNQHLECQHQLARARRLRI